MKKITNLFLLLLFIPGYKLIAQDTTKRFSLPDSVRAVQFLGEIKVSEIPARKEASAGIKTDVVELVLECKGDKKEVVFSFTKGSAIMAKGLGPIETERDELSWTYNWKKNEDYKLLISVASDSAENFSLYSGYIWLPRESKWKLIGTCKITGRWSGLKEPAIFYKARKKSPIRLASSAGWLQRSNGSWINMQGAVLPNPVVLVSNHVDSLEQFNLEKQFIEKAISEGRSGPLQQTEGIYYSIMKEGTGRLVSVTDTVVAFYKGYLFENGAVFDQTRENPATFPLRRLIRGWQIGVPLCKVGGKIKLVIPSGLGYSVRTRAAKIPPNSLLVFEIEVVDVK